MNRASLGGPRGARRVVSGLIAAVFLTTACESTSSPQAGSSPSPTASRERFEPLPRAEPPDLEANLTPESIQRCMPGRVDPASYAGVYASVQDLVAGQVAETRSLEFDAPEVELLEANAFEDAVAALEVKIPEDEEDTTKLLAWALGMVPVGYNVNRFLTGNDAGLIAGFYDPRDGRIVVERNGKLDSEYVVMAHEFAHAAADQRFGLPGTRVEPIVDDVVLARSALVEGDAALSQLRVLSRLSPAKAVEKAIAGQIKFRRAYKQGRLAGVPNLLIDTGVFPYQWGLAFACSVFEEKGWGPLNRAYSKPPTTTAQILFPDRFLEREPPIDPPELAKPSGSWELRDQGQLGAAHLKAMFEAPGDNENEALNDALARAASWAGGEYRVWTLGDSDRRYAVGLSLVEHEDYEGVLCSSMYKWYRAAFSEEAVLVADRVVQLEGPVQDGFMACRGRNVTVAIAPDLDTGAALIGLE